MDRATQMQPCEWPKGTELRIIAVDDGHSPIKIDEVLSKSRTPGGKIKLPGSKDLKVSAEVTVDDAESVLMTEASEWQADCIFIGEGISGNVTSDKSKRVLTELAANATCSIEIMR